MASITDLSIFLSEAKANLCLNANLLTEQNKSLRLRIGEGIPFYTGILLGVAFIL